MFRRKKVRVDLDQMGRLLESYSWAYFGMTDDAQAEAQTFAQGFMACLILVNGRRDIGRWYL